MKSANKKNRGFSLIEMLVAIFIIGVGLVGTLSFLSVNSANQSETKNELIAAGLAQEGAELARSIRDYNLLNGKSWDFNLTSCTAIDFNSLSSHQCSSSGSAVCANANSRYYQCASGNTDFLRTISISSLNADGSRTITCTVTWNGRTTTAKDILYNY